MNCLSMYAYNVVLSKKHIGKKYNMSNLKKYEFYRQERLGGANSPQTNISYRKKKKSSISVRFNISFHRRLRASTHKSGGI